MRGPGNVTFSSPDAAATTAAFSEKGDYVLRLSASDSQITSSDTLTVRVEPGALYPSTDAGPDQSAVSSQTTTPRTKMTSGTLKNSCWKTTIETANR